MWYVPGWRSWSAILVLLGEHIAPQVVRMVVVLLLLLLLHLCGN